MYKKALLPVSGDNRGHRASIALKRAMEVCDGEIVLLHVTEPVPQTVGGETRFQLERDNQTQGMMVLAPIIERLEAAGAHFHTRVVGGIPADVIVNVADEEKADVIVMFTDGRDGLEDMLFGSITERVLRNLNNEDLLAVRGNPDKPVGQ